MTLFLFFEKSKYMTHKVFNNYCGKRNIEKLFRYNFFLSLNFVTHYVMIQEHDMCELIGSFLKQLCYYRLNGRV